MTEITDKDRDRWSRERIAERRAATQSAIAENRLKFQKEQADRKAHANTLAEGQKNQAALAKMASTVETEREITDRSVWLEELQQAFYERKLQLDYEYDAKYRDLNFQEYRLQTTEDIRKERAVIAARCDANIAEYKAQLSGELSKMQLGGHIERGRIREELRATLLGVKAKLEAEIVRKQQEHEHDLAILRAKHEYDIEMEILRDELRRQAKGFSVEELADVMQTMSGLR